MPTRSISWITPISDSAHNSSFRATRECRPVAGVLFLNAAVYCGWSWKNPTIVPFESVTNKTGCEPFWKTAL